jgi:hypothetical protein
VDSRGNVSAASAPATIEHVDPTVSRSFTLSWDAPATSADGTALTDLAGFTVHLGVQSRVYGSSSNVGLVTQKTFENMAPGTYFMTVVAYDKAGNKSQPGAEVSWVVR